MFNVVSPGESLLPDFSNGRWRPLKTAGGALTVTTTWANDANHHKDAETIFGKTGAKFDALWIQPVPVTLTDTDFHAVLQIIVSNTVISTSSPLFTTQFDAGAGAMEVPLGISKAGFGLQETEDASYEVQFRPFSIPTPIGRYVDFRISGVFEGTTVPTIVVWGHSKRPV